MLLSVSPNTCTVTHEDNTKNFARTKKASELHSYALVRHYDGILQISHGAECGAVPIKDEVVAAEKLHAKQLLS